MSASSLTPIIKALPNESGVYQFFNKHGTLIYVGKAKNIKKRVRSYFSGKKNIKTHLLVEHIYHIEPIITKDEHSALLLENTLIKQHQPQFNILLKDDKTYPYIKITTIEPFPKIIITRNKQPDNNRYFGPYTSYGSTKKLKQLLYDLFPLRDCKQKIDLSHQQKKCIKLDIGKCIGPCIYKHIQPEYNQLVHQCIQFLEGKSQQILDALSNTMQTLSNQKKYEKAAMIRDRIEHLKTIQEQQQSPLDTQHRHFFIGFSSNDDFHYGVCQQYANKRFISQHGKYTPSNMPLDAFIHSFCSFFLDEAPSGSRVVIDASTANHPYFSKEHSLQLLTPSKGKLHEHLQLSILNAKKSLLGLTQKTTPFLKSKLELLKQSLHLQRTPIIIFGCDISHFYGTNIVSSVVVFINEKPVKKYYRHFNIKSITSGKSNDVKAMKETVERLIQHFPFLPDLLLIDGGKGQLNAALSALHEAHIDIDCIGLAKKNEDIYSPYEKQPICLAHHHRGLQLLRHVRDEAHRFALQFQRKKRQLDQ